MLWLNLLAASTSGHLDARVRALESGGALRLRGGAFAAAIVRQAPLPQPARLAAVTQAAGAAPPGVTLALSRRFDRLRGGGSPQLLYGAVAKLPAGLVLAITIVLEVFATTCMKMASTGPRAWYAGVAVGYALAYWLISLRLGKELSISGALPAALGAWTAVILTGTAGLILARKAFAR